MAKPMRDLLDSKTSPRTARGKAIATARERHGDGANWKKIFKKLDATKPKK